MRASVAARALKAARGGFSMSVEVGSKAPDFTLMDQDRTPVTLSTALRRGPVVLAFFPAAFSSVCQQEMCTFRDSIATLGQAGHAGQVFGISTDTFFALKAWAEQQRLNFPLLSDYNKDVIRRYGVVNPDMIGLKDIAKRAVFVIDRDGIVRHREVLEDARNEPDYGKVRAALAGLEV
jgi:peroxiredoxin